MLNKPQLRVSAAVQTECCRYAAPIREDLEAYVRRMQLFSDALEEWTELQRTWIRLEGVFGTPDFKRQMPEQSQQFGDVDKQFRAIVQHVRDKPAALQVRTWVLCQHQAPLHPYAAANSWQKPCRSFQKLPEVKLRGLVWVCAACVAQREGSWRNIVGHEVQCGVGSKDNKGRFACVAEYGGIFCGHVLTSPASVWHTLWPGESRQYARM